MKDEVEAMQATAELETMQNAKADDVKAGQEALQFLFEGEGANEPPGHEAKLDAKEASAASATPTGKKGKSKKKKK